MHMLQTLKCSTKYKNRDGRSKKRGGGVALAYRASLCSFRERKIKNHHGFEILCATGTIGRISRRVVVFVIYLPSRVADLNEVLGSERTAVKLAFGDPLIFIGGDMNGKNLSDALAVDDKLDLIHTGPTRGNNTLDLVYTNAEDHVTESTILPPLETECRKRSDHACVNVRLTIPRTKDFVWQRKTTRKRTYAGDDKFADALWSCDWGELLVGNPDEMVASFNTWLSRTTDDCFTLQTIRVWSNEEPWITNCIWRRATKKRSAFTNGRGVPGDGWTQTRLYSRRKLPVAGRPLSKKILEMPEKSYYAAVKQLSGPGKRRAWTVWYLFPHLGPMDTAAKILDYFSKVGGEAPPSEPAGLGDFTPERVEALLRKHKKTSSAVEGDPMPHLVRSYPNLFAVPVAIIFQAVENAGAWPSQ